MKLPTFEHNLGRQRREMNAERLAWDTKGWDDGNIENLSEALRRGQDVILGDLDLAAFEDLDAFITDDGIRFLVYIREQEGLYKYHLKMCNHLVGRRNQNTLTNRYVATVQKSNEFTITGQYANSPVRRVKLDVCQFCLGGVGWVDDEYGAFKYNRINSADIVKRFHPSTYFSRYIEESFDSDIPRDVETVPNQYSTSHSTISLMKKELVNYTCQSCGLSLANNPNKNQYLHLHHVNGVKSDYDYENLEVLCVICHDNAHEHSISPVVMQAFKREFGIS